MELEEIASKLRSEAQALATDVPGAKWYLFGSVARRAKLPIDVDLLIVYQNDSDVRELRKGLEPLSGSLPLHLLFLREDEENELQFIAEQRAMRIFPDTA